MLAISNRGNQMPASPIRKLVPFAEAAKKRGTKVFHLNIGQPDIETPPAILDAVRNADIKVLEYSHSAGNESYRRKLVQYYQKVGIDVNYDQIMITTGGSEAILFGFFTCLNPGDEVIVPEPFYANYNGFACAAGVNVIPITSHIETGFALPPIDEFEKVIDWSYYYPYSFESPYAAYLLPPDLKINERVFLEDLIEDVVGLVWNQGDKYRLSSVEAIWNGNDFELDYQKMIDKNEIVG